MAPVSRSRWPDDWNTIAGRESPGPHARGETVSYDYDVVVVGARVAGASTAMLLARQGHRVVMVERAAVPSDTVSTHAITRSGVVQLSRWGLLDEVLDAGTPAVREVTLGFGDQRIDFEVRSEFGVDHFVAPRRYLLDGVLAEAAQDAGAELRDGTIFKSLLRNDSGRVDGVVVKGDGGPTPIRARFVVGADGHHSRVAGQADSFVYRSHEPLNAVNYAYFDGIDHRGFWFQFTPEVNTGLVPTNDDQCLVFAGRPTRQKGAFSRDPDGEFMALIRRGGTDLADIVAAGHRASRFHGTSGLSGFLRQPYGPGWALVGDAGYTEDPISAHGISDALRDAELCARAIDTALGDPSLEDAAFGWYHEMRDRVSVDVYEAAADLARYEWDPDTASRRMRTISEATRAECELLTGLPRWDRVPVPLSA